MAAVCCQSIKDCVRFNVKDSKVLSPNRREFLFNKISKDFTIAIISIEPAEIDKILDETTINDCIARADAKLIMQLRPNIVYLDACDVNAKRYADTVRNYLDYSCTIISRHKADSIYPVVAAASIVAKVQRDRQVSILKERFGDFGSGYPSDPRTRNYLEGYIQKYDEVPSFARKKWKTVSSFFSERNQSKLKDFFSSKK